MSVSPSAPVAVPPMPMEWTAEAVRALSPVRLARRIRLELFMQGRNGLPGMGLTINGKYERFPASAAGWVAGWNRIALETGPEGYAKATASWAEKRRWTSTPMRDAAVTADLDAQMPAVLSNLTFLGSHGHGELLSAGACVDLRQAASEIVVTAAPDGERLLAVPASQLVGAEASGPGKTVGPFAATVGHGLMGDLIEVQAAQWMNGRFGGRRIRTLIRIQGTSLELFFTSASQLPEQAQVALSAVRAMAPAAAAGQAAPAAQAAPAGPAGPVGLLAGMTAEPGPVASGGPAPDDDADLVTKLERLARLRDSGVLTKFEFQAAKDKLLH